MVQSTDPQGSLVVAEDGVVKQCKRGHPRIPENTGPTGRCRPCEGIRTRERKARTKPLVGELACAKPTPKYPSGRTGTFAGWGAHTYRGESPCDACRLAQLEYQRLMRVPVLPEERRRRQKLGSRKAWERAVEEYADRPVCEIRTARYPDGRTGTVRGYAAHWHKGEPACAPCLEAAAAHGRGKDPALNRKVNLRSRFGITMADYDRMLAEQGGGCAICGKTVPGHAGGASRSGFHVDHDHGCCPGKTSCGKCVRGLLCGPCNTGMGNLGDDSERLIAAAKYLLAARKRRSDATTPSARAGDAT